MPTPFPFEPDGSTPFHERFAYLTGIMTAESGREQRTRHRMHEAGGFEFDALEADVLAGVLNAWMYRHQADQIAVPLWPYRNHTTTDLAAGAMAIPMVDDRIFRDQDSGLPLYALLWASPTVYELVHATSTTGGDTLVLDAELAEDWPAGSLVLPTRLSYLTPSTKLAWFGQSMLGRRLVFEMDNTGPGIVGFNDPDPLTDEEYATSIYGRMETEPGRLVPVEDDYRHAFRVLGSPLGAHYADVLNGPENGFTWPRLARSFLWQGSNPYFMKGWLGQRRGRAIPFWLWPYERELILAQAHSAGASLLVIRFCSYTARLLDAPARRYIRLRYADGTGLDTTISGSTDNLDGTETLNIFPYLDRDVPIDALVGFRRFCRLDSDEITLEHAGPDWCEATLPVVELPNEVQLPES